MFSSSEAMHNYIFAPSDKEMLITIADKLMAIQQTVQEDRFRAVFDSLDDTRTKIMRIAESLSTWSTSTNLDKI